MALPLTRGWQKTFEYTRFREKVGTVSSAVVVTSALRKAAKGVSFAHVGAGASPKALGRWVRGDRFRQRGRSAHGQDGTERRRAGVCRRNAEGMVDGSRAL